MIIRISSPARAGSYSRSCFRHRRMKISRNWSGFMKSILIFVWMRRRKASSTSRAESRPKIWQFYRPSESRRVNVETDPVRSKPNRFKGQEKRGALKPTVAAQRNSSLYSGTRFSGGRDVRKRLWKTSGQPRTQATFRPETS